MRAGMEEMCEDPCYEGESETIDFIREIIYYITPICNVLTSSFQAVIVAKLVADAADSDERPLHSVIFKIGLNWFLAMNVITDFDLSAIEPPESAAGGLNVEVPKFQMPPE